MMAFDPDWVVKPGETLQEMLDEYNLSPRIAAVSCGLTERDLQNVLDGKRITKRIAAGLARLPVTPSAQFWLNLEHNYRKGLAAGKTKELE